MKRAIILSIILLPAIIYSCKKDPAPPVEQTPVAMDYVITRGDADLPDEGTTYTIISYRNGATTEPDNTGPNLLQQPVGKYAFQNDAAQGILIPCDVADTYPYNFNGRNPNQGQKLLAGSFQTAIISPAYPMIFHQGLGSTRICFPKDADEINASAPFPITVAGYQVFPIPAGLEMKDIRAKIKFDVYQGATTEYEIEDGELRNAGSYGWYHPLLQVTDITNSPSPLSPTGLASVDTCAIKPTGNKGTDVKTHSTVEKFVFATDYGDGYTAALTLAFDLDMQNHSFPVTIPLTINMKKSTLYHFDLVVKSTAVRVTYTVRPWDTGYDDEEYQPIGTPPTKILLGEWSINNKEWIDGGGGDDEIGN